MAVRHSSFIKAKRPKSHLHCSIICNTYTTFAVSHIRWAQTIADVQCRMLTDLPVTSFVTSTKLLYVEYR